MANKTMRNIVHSDDELKIASDYFEYHVRMFVESYLWLQSKKNITTQRDLLWNAILEDFLIHTRALINFVSKSEGRNDDVIAKDFFHDNQTSYCSMNDNFLNEWANKIGGFLVHITKKPMPNLKSQQKWPIDDIVILLKPGLISFLNAVSDSRLATDVRKESFSHLVNLNPPKITVSLNVST